MKILPFVTLLAFILFFAEGAHAGGDKDIHDCIKGIMNGNGMLSVPAPPKDEKDLIAVEHYFVNKDQLFRAQLNSQIKEESAPTFCMKIGEKHVWVKCQNKVDCAEDVAVQNKVCSDDKRQGYSRIPAENTNLIYHITMGICYRQAMHEYYINKAAADKNKELAQFYYHYFENYEKHCAPLEQYITTHKENYVGCNEVIARMRQTITDNFGYKFTTPMKSGPASKANTKGSGSKVQ